MKAVRQLGLLMPLTLLACATAVTQDLSEPDDEGQGATGGSDSVIPNGGTMSNSGGKASAGSSTSGTGPKAFGGTATSGGTDSGEAGEGSGGSDAGSSAGGKASGGSSSGSGSGGSTSGGTGGSSAGTGGKAGAGSGSGGSPVGPGDCSGTPLFMAGASTKYALNARVVATCNGGTPCTQEQPPLEQGKAYEFNCIDQYNCGGVDPATTNWSIPPWTVVKACE